MRVSIREGVCCHRPFRSSLGTLGSTEEDCGREVFVLAVVGNNPDAEEALRDQVVGESSPLLSSWPKNVHIRLRDAAARGPELRGPARDARGANSVLESLWAEVPMVVVPGQADQFHNARMVHKQRWGRRLAAEGSIRSGFMEAVREVLGNAEYRGNVQNRAEEMRAAGGAARAAEILLEYAAEPSTPSASACMINNSHQGAVSLNA